MNKEAQPGKHVFISRIPVTMHNALLRRANENGRSRNSELIQILREALDWRYYEEDDPALSTDFVYFGRKHLNNR